MPYTDWLDRDTWLGKEVEFKLFGKWVRGHVCEIQYNMPFGRCVIAEFHDGAHHVKVAGSYQSFRLIK